MVGATACGCHALNGLMDREWHGALLLEFQLWQPTGGGELYLATILRRWLRSICTLTSPVKSRNLPVEVGAVVLAK